MLLDQLGEFRLGNLIVIPWNTFTRSGASVTATSVTITVSKNGGLTERVSSSGITTSTDHDGHTGTHLVAIDTSDDSDAGFYTAGGDFQVRCDAATVGGKSVTVWLVSFRLAAQVAAADTAQAIIAEAGATESATGQATSDPLQIVLDESAAVNVAAIEETASDTVQPVLDESAILAITAGIAASDTAVVALDESAILLDITPIPYSASDELLPVLAETPDLFKISHLTASASDELVPVIADSFGNFQWFAPAAVSIVAMPSAAKIAKVRFLLHAPSQSLVSPLSQSEQTVEILGARWLATYELAAMIREEAEEWIAWLTSLNGMSGRFYGHDPSAASPRGAASGSPVTDGGGQVGTSLASRGWTPNTLILRAGDYIAWNAPSGWRELHQVTADATSDGSGGATLSLAPPVRESPADGESLIVTAASCVMRLKDDSAEWTVDEAMTYGIQFCGDESFLTRERS